jgi:asparagine synthase (glutamine-hydrolysing)
MCGIAGILSTSPRPMLAAELKTMNTLAAHRGPDDQGMAVFTVEGACNVGEPSGGPEDGPWVAGLGHRRLSIIDLSAAGHQPMCDAAGRYWIVYNGEVYNYLELRSELKSGGCRFRSNTDSEVVFQAFLEWGPACLRRFNGMWAFAIYDSATGDLFCARDRFGIKPFYLAVERGRFAFASEIKQLLALPWVSPAANTDRLGDFFLWGFETHTDQTFFEHVRSMPAAHYVRLTRDGLERGRVEAQRYWAPSPGMGISDSHAISEFRDLLSDSVRLRLRSDVPIGVTLSGGLDSSSVVCLAGGLRGNGPGQAPLHAFNVEFEGAGYSERSFAEAAAGKAGAQMIVLKPSSADLERDWTRFVWHMEEPFGGLSYFSNYQIYRLIRQHGIPVVLSGQGGDELLLGYERYRTYDTLFKLRAMQPSAALAEVRGARRHANMPLTKQLAYGIYFLLPLLRAMKRRHLLRPILNQDFFRGQKGKTTHLRSSTLHRDRLGLQDAELFRYQLPHLLRHEDRVSMAHSVETRLPFLDYRLLDLVLGQPLSLLFRDGWSKYLLRQAMEGILPTEVQKRFDKMGYETPTGRLIRQNRDVFIPLLARHRGDSVLDVPAIERRFGSRALDDRLLCRAVSYLSWKETYSVV